MFVANVENVIMNFLIAENLAAKLVSHNFVNLFRTLAPVFDYIFSPYLIDLSNRFVSKVPFSVLFP